MTADHRILALLPSLAQTTTDHPLLWEVTEQMH